MLLQVDPEAQEVVIGGPDGPEHLRYDVLNVVPPQAAPDWLRLSSLPATGDDGGFVEVDPETLRHPRYPNVWSLGDAAGTTNAKSGGALRKQTYVVAKNVAAVLQGKEPRKRYDGYTVCPSPCRDRRWCGRSSTTRATSLRRSRSGSRMYRENRLAWVFDRHVLPWVYWNLILTGRV